MPALIIITRPGSAGAQLCRLLDADGLSSLHLPGLELAPLSPGADQAGIAEQAGWWFFTSPAAINYAADWLRAMGLDTVDQRRLAVLSRRSAEQLAEAMKLEQPGAEMLPVNMLWPAEGHRSEDLLTHPDLQSVDTQTMVIFNAPDGRRTLPEELQRRGARVTEINVYQRRPARLDQHAVRQLDDWRGQILSLWTSNTAISHLQQQLNVKQWRKLLAGDHLVLSARQRTALEQACHATMSTGKIELAQAPDNPSLKRQLVRLCGATNHQTD